MELGVLLTQRRVELVGILIGKSVLETNEMYATINNRSVLRMRERWWWLSELDYPRLSLPFSVVTEMMLIGRQVRSVNVVLLGYNFWR